MRALPVRERVPHRCVGNLGRKFGGCWDLKRLFLNCCFRRSCNIIRSANVGVAAAVKRAAGPSQASRLVPR